MIWRGSRIRPPRASKAAKTAIRDLREGRYLLAAGRLDKILRSEDDAAGSELLLAEIVQAISAAGVNRTELDILEPILTYRVAGLNVILEALNEGKTETAREWLEAFLAHFPDDPAGLTLLSLANETLGNYEAALTAANRLVGVAFGDPISYSRRAAVYEAMGNAAAANDDQSKASDAFRQAVADYDVLTSINSNACEAYVDRGRLYRKLSDIERAERDFTHAIECDPELVDAYYERAATAEARGNSRQAIKDYNLVVNLAPNMTEGFVGRARIWVDLGQWNKAEQDLTEALRIDPSSWAAHYERGVGYLKLAEQRTSEEAYDQARVAYETSLSAVDAALVTNPNDPSVHWIRAFALRALDAYDWATDAFERVLRSPETTDVSRARILAERGEAFRMWGSSMRERTALERAIADYHQARESGGDDPELRWVSGGVGAALLALGQHDEAWSAFDIALQSEPTSVWSLVGRGKVQLAQGNNDGAYQDFMAAEAASTTGHADRSWPAVGQGLALDRMGQESEASVAYANALEASADGKAYLKRAALFEDYGTPEAIRLAEMDYRAALTADPHLAETYNGLAWLFADKSPTDAHLAEALELAQRSTSLSPPGPEAGFALDTLGWVQYLLGQYDEAVRTLEKAYKMAPYRLIRRAHLHAARAKA
jgi:tetratricopeptide (TPR) repeat protein